MHRERRQLRVRGVVQGVGFRPFVFGLARRQGLAGFVLNDGEGVLIEVEGGAAALDSFAAAVVGEAPSLARVDDLVAVPLPTLGETDFAIVASRPAAGSALVPPDVATCDDCLRELFDPADRRHRYPFVELHAVRAAVHDRDGRPVRPAEHDHGRVRDVRRLPP